MHGLTYPTYMNDFAVGSSIGDGLVPRLEVGTAVRFTISPDLPSGLELDKVTGVISGTPQVTSQPITYTVSAFGIVGEARVLITIEIHSSTSGLGYSDSKATYVVGVAIAPNTPQMASGQARQFTVNPDLPLGLALDAKTGIISGVPALSSAKQTYQVTASGKGGSSDVAEIQIEIGEGMLWERVMNLEGS